MPGRVEVDLQLTSNWAVQGENSLGLNLIAFLQCRLTRKIADDPELFYVMGNIYTFDI